MVTSSVGETLARRFFYALLQIGSSLLVDRGGGLLVTWRKSGSRACGLVTWHSKEFEAVCWQRQEICSDLLADQRIGGSLLLA